MMMMMMMVCRCGTAAGRRLCPRRRSHHLFLDLDLLPLPLAFLLLQPTWLTALVFLLSSPATKYSLCWVWLIVCSLLRFVPLWNDRYAVYFSWLCTCLEEAPPTGIERILKAKMTMYNWIGTIVPVPFLLRIYHPLIRWHLEMRTSWYKNSPSKTD